LETCGTKSEKQPQILRCAQDDICNQVRAIPPLPQEQLRGKDGAPDFLAELRGVI
jgi:hypothetical protein